MTTHEGGCICSQVRYQVSAEPTRVTICNCRFCQRGTGSAYLLEPIFAKGAFAITKGTPKTYVHTSEGSGKTVTINFCANCGTKLFLDLERFPDVVGVFGGTFDDPNWFPRTPENTRYIYTGVAQQGLVLPAGFPTFEEHAMKLDGSGNEGRVFGEPHVVGEGGHLR